MKQSQEFTQASADEARTKRLDRFKQSGAQVVEYKDIGTVFADNPESGKELQEKMDKIIAAFEHDPTALKTISSFGVKPIQEMGVVAKRVFDAQTRMNETVKTLKVKMDELENNAVEAGIKNLWGALKSGGGEALEAGGSALKGLGGFLKRSWNGVTGKNKKQTAQQKHIQDMIDSLPEMWEEMRKLMAGLNGAEEGIEGLIKEAESLGKARTNMVRELNVYLGVAPEILRRYDEVYIKEAVEYWEQSGRSEETRAQVLDTEKAREYFHTQFVMLEASRAQGIEAAHHLRAMIDLLKKQKMMIQQFKDVRMAEWTGLMSSAGLTASNLKVAEMIRQSEEAGDRLHDLGMNMQKKAHEMTMASEGRGTVDTQKLIEALEQRQQMLEAEQEMRKQRYLEAETARQQLRAAAEKTLEAAEKNISERIRTLDAAAAEDQDPLDQQPDAVEPATTDAAEPAEAVETHPSNDNKGAAQKAVRRTASKRPKL